MYSMECIYRYRAWFADYMVGHSSWVLTQGAQILRGSMHGALTQLRRAQAAAAAAESLLLRGGHHLLRLLTLHVGEDRVPPKRAVQVHVGQV